MLVIAGSLSLNAQRGGMRGMRMDSARMGMQGRGMMRPPASVATVMPGMRDTMRMGMMKHNMDSMQRHMMQPMAPGMRQMPGMRGGTGQMQGHGQRFAPQAQFGMHRSGKYAPQPDYAMRGMRRGMGMMYGHGRSMGHMPMNQMGQGNIRPGRPMIESIPNLTDKQKKDLAELRVKHQEEIKKFREEMAAKMQALRDANRTKIMNMLTDEQKKVVDPEFGRKTTPPATKK